MDTNSPTLTIFYDGACPLCAREIAFYRRRKGAERLRWMDVAQLAPDQDVAPGLARADALARFHVMDAHGKLISGGRAFAEIMAQLDGLRIIGRVLRREPLASLLDGAYAVFLPVRPRLQRLFGGRRDKPACTDDGACDPVTSRRR
ncbi:MAG: thiol-disulfide oxidoreductase DCC family protein [Salinarimonas sp.]